MLRIPISYHIYKPHSNHGVFVSIFNEAIAIFRSSLFMVTLVKSTMGQYFCRNLFTDNGLNIKMKHPSDIARSIFETGW